MQATEVDDIYDLKLRQLIEDEIFSELESLDTKVLDQKKKIAAQGEQLAAQGEQIAAQGEQLAAQGEQLAAQGEQIAAQGEQIAAQGEQIAAAVRAFASRGLQSAEIAGIMNLSQESVEEMLKQ